MMMMMIFWLCWLFVAVWVFLLLWRSEAVI